MIPITMLHGQVTRNIYIFFKTEEWQEGRLFIKVGIIFK